MAAFMAKKKAEDMRAELKNIISFTRGPAAWEELLRTEGDIRKKGKRQYMPKKNIDEKFLNGLQ